MLKRAVTTLLVIYFAGFVYWTVDAIRYSCIDACQPSDWLSDIQVKVITAVLCLLPFAIVGYTLQRKGLSRKQRTLWIAGELIVMLVIASIALFISMASSIS
jgi:hypothetical protein